MPYFRHSLFYDGWSLQLPYVGEFVYHFIIRKLIILNNLLGAGECSETIR